MPYFRERTHSGLKGRLRFPFLVEEEARYESPLKQRNVDFALRWAHNVGVWDFGVYHFYGTNREPRYTPNVTASGEVRLTPNYDLVHQTGFESQLTIEGLLVKFEFLSRHWQPRHYVALVGGFEYTFNGILESATDLGFIMEYAYDNRRDQATTPFENDLFTGFRFAFNDIEDTQILGGMVSDLDSSSKFVNLEANRRIGDHFLVTLEVRGFLLHLQG